MAIPTIPEQWAAKDTYIVMHKAINSWERSQFGNMTTYQCTEDLLKPVIYLQNSRHLIVFSKSFQQVCQQYLVSHTNRCVNSD